MDICCYIAIGGRALEERSKESHHCQHMLVVVISNQPRWVQSKQRHKIARILHANLDLSTNQHICVCVCVCERESLKFVCRFSTN